MTNCSKCTGLMVADICYSYATGERIFVDRCLNCGNIEDDIILNNRILIQPEFSHSNKRGCRAAKSYPILMRSN